MQTFPMEESTPWASSAGRCRAIRIHKQDRVVKEIDDPVVDRPAEIGEQLPSGTGSGSPEARTDCLAIPALALREARWIVSVSAKYSATP